ncbi:MAG: FKBP-type peptidyl-prolyl cis-trans isomerase [Duncaniella sp.]|uniref:FKBP-type peptidyl-prolyl cis-trans isomerase n=1 Tax=Duncaniella sp. TaxID=2518496 RepID=UPI0023C8FA36|nr:FKBP-type peptidyl-prolyl cis-trans isomerase [Duncaniella sp.]MDE5989519.1 FKBP-type peptidyl-prolyl cis-trans isomerase [Duncaniella sp.]MDE6174836.1 FKBP-type peptidyl-prolyl cis-trans isomerase [Duncaniella sp.]
MKKLLMVCGVAALMFGATSCNKTSSSDSANKGFGDSLSVAIGSSQGSRILSDYMSLPAEQQANFKKDDILRGLKQALMTDTTQQGYLTGLQFGMQLFGQVLRYEEAGIPIDRAKLYEAYAKAFSADSVDADQMRELQIQFQTLAQEAQQKMMAYYQEQEAAARAAKEDSPEAKENVAKGEAYLKDLMAKDPEIKVTESGLAYKVVKEGTGEAVGANGSAKVKYTGKLIDGKEFDSNSEGVVMNPNRVVPGFGEGLSMMKNGSQYVLYIPGKLAYGVDGNPQAGIAPNAMLVFEVETSDVTPAN